MADPPLIVLHATIILLLVSCYAYGAVIQRVPSNQEPVSLKGLVDSLRFTVVGSPAYHAKQRWQFDPEVSARRSREFQAIHGPRSQGLIERLGLGEDGREEERRIQQALRDQGVPITRLRRRK